MKFWTRFSFNSKFKLKFIENHIKLIATSGSIISMGTVLYLFSNETKIFASINENKFDEQKPFENKFKECNRIAKRYKEQYGIPGLMVGVSKNGKLIYSKGFGYSDVENNVKANPHTVVRIASISKPLSCSLATKLFEIGKLDFDKPINYYLNDLPAIKWNNKDVTSKITTRSLMCHTSGIRHYDKPESKNEKDNCVDDKHDKSYKDLYPAKNSTSDSLNSEFFLNKNYKTTREALEIFINDDLQFEPGKGYLYTTYGFTLLSAVLERCNNGKKFTDMLIELFKLLDMNETYIDLNNPLITYRSKYYVRNEKKALVNVPFVDNSYKWAGGGILSTVGDLLKYGNHLLDSYKNETGSKSTFFKCSTLKSQVWTAQSDPSKKKSSTEIISGDPIETPKEKEYYGLGWHVFLNTKDNSLEYVYHTGGAVGATSCLLIIPSKNSDESGIVVSVLCNLQDVGEIVKFSQNIGNLFLENTE